MVRYSSRQALPRPARLHTLHMRLTSLDKPLRPLATMLTPAFHLPKSSPRTARSRNRLRSPTRPRSSPRSAHKHNRRALCMAIDLA